jgi:hypothetical protein
MNLWLKKYSKKSCESLEDLKGSQGVPEHCLGNTTISYILSIHLSRPSFLHNSVFHLNFRPLFLHNSGFHVSFSPLFLHNSGFHLNFSPSFQHNSVFQMNFSPSFEHNSVFHMNFSPLFLHNSCFHMNFRLMTGIITGGIETISDYVQYIIDV